MAVSARTSKESESSSGSSSNNMNGGSPLPRVISIRSRQTISPDSLCNQDLRDEEENVPPCAATSGPRNGKDCSSGEGGIVGGVDNQNQNAGATPASAKTVVTSASRKQQIEQAANDAVENHSKRGGNQNSINSSVVSFAATNLKQCSIAETGESEDDEISTSTHDDESSTREQEKQQEDDDTGQGQEDSHKENRNSGGSETILEVLQLSTIRGVPQDIRAGAGSLASSNYWKGLLVGLFLCQAIFVPLWAAVAADGSPFGAGIVCFLQVSFWKSIVGAVAGFGFVVIGVVGIEYDRTLKEELEDLRRQANSHKQALRRPTPTMKRESTPTMRGDRGNKQGSRTVSLRRRGGRQQQQQDTQPTSCGRTRARDVVVGTSAAAAPGNSLSETAPSTALGAENHDDDNGDLLMTDPDEARNKSSAQEKNQEECDTVFSFDKEDMAAAHRPLTTMAVTTNTMKKTQDNKSTSKSLSFYSRNRCATLSLSSHTGTNNIEEQHPAEENQQDRDESQSFPTKDIAFARSTSDTFPATVVSQHSLGKTGADFYPDATVLFAHISGFAAWTSERGPDQVFQLLEKLHNRFDEAAQRLAITKVDVSSESYMAVSGVPFDQPDHAVRMVKFAKKIMQSMVNIVTALEGTLGPDTGSLRLRIGCHSGSLCAGMLGGRFQVSGNTVGIASSMEATSHRHRIQISEATADLLRKWDKEDWVQKREGHMTTTKDGCEIQTYFVVITSPLSGRSGTGSYRGSSLRSCSQNAGAASMLRMDDTPKCLKRQVWGGYQDNFMMTLPPMSHSAKKKRLIAWVNKVLSTQLAKVMMQRGSTEPNDFDITPMVLDRVAHGAVPSEEYVDVIRPAKTSHRCDRCIPTGEQSGVDLPANVAQQLRAVVTTIAGLYKEDNPYHGFEHATHTTMSVQKLLNRCIAHGDDLDDTGPEAFHASKSLASRSTARDYMNGTTMDAFSQFAVLWSALVHDCGHEGLSSRQLTRLKPKLSETYEHESVMEQQSIDLAWEILVDPQYADLHKCLFSSEGELLRFRQILVNSVLATDLSNGKRQAIRNERWYRAFHSDSCDTRDADADLKATAVLECLVQASDSAHAMQHWKVYQKWSERFFREKCIAHDAGKSFCNPQETWYQEELSFLDNYVITLAKQLAESGVFGVASNECLNHALENRKEWARRGEDLLQEMYARYRKRKDMEVGGFTNEEINNFTSKDLQYILIKLVEKGRNNGTNEVDEEKGQNDAAQAWLDALEIYERCPASMEMSDRSIIFPIYSGLYGWIKGERIPQDQDGNFEVNIARKFVQESKLHMDPIHHTRALAMLAEVYGRRGQYVEALAEFKKLAEIYSCEAHSAAIAAVYGTDRSSHAFSFSALWHEQLGNSEEATATCEYVIQDLLPMMDPANTLGNFELLLNVLRVMKPKGQERRMHNLLNEHIILPFRKHHGPNGFTPCIKVFKPLLWLLDICADPGNFSELDAAVEWLMEEENGVIEDFVDSIYAKAGWAPHDMVAELCLRLANRLALGDGDPARQSVLIRKGLMLARSTERKIKDADGNVMLPIANAMHEPVFHALEEISRQMGLDCDVTLLQSKGKQLNVNLPPSYLRDPNRATSSQSLSQENDYY